MALEDMGEKNESEFEWETRMSKWALIKLEKSVRKRRQVESKDEGVENDGRNVEGTKKKKKKRYRFEPNGIKTSDCWHRDKYQVVLIYSSGCATSRPPSGKQ